MHARNPIRSATHALLLLGATATRSIVSSLLLFEHYEGQSAGLRELMLLSLLTANHARETSLRLLYAGTLGRKHNPDLLADLVRELRGRGVDAEMVVVSEGEGAAQVARRAADEPGLRVLPYQEASQLPERTGAVMTVVMLGYMWSMYEGAGTRIAIVAGAVRRSR